MHQLGGVEPGAIHPERADIEVTDNIHETRNVITVLVGQDYVGDVCRVAITLRDVVDDPLAGVFYPPSVM
jgi:hypothetical protein